MVDVSMFRVSKPVARESILSVLLNAKPGERKLRVTFRTKPPSNEAIRTAERFLWFAEDGQILISEKCRARLNEVVRKRAWPNHQEAFCFMIGEKFSPASFAKNFGGWIVRLEMVRSDILPAPSSVN